MAKGSNNHPMRMGKLTSIIINMPSWILGIDCGRETQELGEKTAGKRRARWSILNTTSVLLTKFTEKKGPWHTQSTRDDPWK